MESSPRPTAQDWSRTRRLISDPSLLLSPAGAEVVEEARGVGVEIVVPQTFVEALEGRIDLNLEALVAPEDLDALGASVDQARQLLATGVLVPFSADGVELRGDAQSVLGQLLSNDDPIARLDADEWAFLQSNSWLASKLRRPLDAFRDAGAVIVEVGRDFGMKLIGEVIPSDHIPPNVTPELVMRASVKWLVVGGAGFGGGTLGGSLGTMVGGPVGGTVGHVLVGRAVKRAAKATVLAIDP
jgi:hypothetical protein